MALSEEKEEISGSGEDAEPKDDDGEHGTNDDDDANADAVAEATNGATTAEKIKDEEDASGSGEDGDGADVDKEGKNEEEEDDVNANDDQEDNDNDGDNSNDEDDDDESVATTRTAETDREKSGKNHSFPSHIPDYLDQSTLKGIKSYLDDFGAAPGELDEDEIVILMTKADRNVEHRARYYSNPLDDMIDEENMVKDFYKEEEEYLVGHDFMKEMTTALQAKKRRGVDKRTLNWVKRAAGLNRKDYHSAHSALAGDDHDSDAPGGGKPRAGPRRYTRGMARSTRIKKKEEFIFKDNLGIKSLLDAIEEMEPEAGPYPRPFELRLSRERAKARLAERKRPSARASFREGSDDESAKPMNNRKDNSHLLLNRPLVARLTEEDVLEGSARMSTDYLFGDHRDILVTKVIVNGEHVEEDKEDQMSLNERKRELKRMRDRQYQKRKRDVKNREKNGRARDQARAKFTTPIRSNTKRRRDYDSETEEDRQPRRSKKRSSKRAKRGVPPTRSLKGPISLALLDWQRRQMWTPGKQQKRALERDIRSSVAIPEYMSKSGIGYRLPPWESVNPASNISKESNHFEPPKEMHSDDVYATWSHKLINCLNGSARSWAIHEFFYSDIDRSWYNINTFAREVAKLGILPTAKLTRREWSAVRRTMRKRPRRFSKRFIFSQLKERNKFRNFSRQLQQQSDVTNHTGYEIAAPIRVGATVTAYNKRYLILHRGVVLFHDVASARYLVQFERKELGFELCSDTEVASHGVPDIMMPAAPSRLTGSPHHGGIGDLAGVGVLPYGTSFGPLSVTKSKDSITCEKEFASILIKSPTIGSIPADEGAAREAVVEKVAERETLVTLMSIVDAAASRKEMLLDVMEKFNILLVDHLPFGEGPPANHVMSGYFQTHYAWLRANLESTNQTLDLAQFYLKTMYGKAYSSTSVSARLRNEKIKKMFTETVLAQDRLVFGGPPTATMPWLGALGRGSKEVGGYLASLVCHESGQQKSAPSSKSLQSRVAAAGGVLSAIGYCSGRSAESDIVLPDGDAPLLESVLEANLGDLGSPKVSTSDSNGALQEIISDKAAAEKELKEAFAMLNKEFNCQAIATRPLFRPVGM